MSFKISYLAGKVRDSFGCFVFFSRVDNALLMGGFIEFLVNHFDLLPECRDVIGKALNRNGLRSRFYRGAYREKYKRSKEHNRRMLGAEFHSEVPPKC